MSCEYEPPGCPSESELVYVPPDVSENVKPESEPTVTLAVVRLVPVMVVGMATETVLTQTSPYASGDVLSDKVGEAATTVTLTLSNCAN